MLLPSSLKWGHIFHETVNCLNFNIQYVFYELNIGLWDAIIAFCPYLHFTLHSNFFGTGCVSSHHQDWNKQKSFFFHFDKSDQVNSVYTNGIEYQQHRFEEAIWSDWYVFFALTQAHLFLAGIKTPSACHDSVFFSCLVSSFPVLFWKITNFPLVSGILPFLLCQVSDCLPWFPKCFHLFPLVPHVLK